MKKNLKQIAWIVAFSFITALLAFGIGFNIGKDKIYWKGYEDGLNDRLLIIPDTNVTLKIKIQKP